MLVDVKTIQIICFIIKLLIRKKKQISILIVLWNRKISNLEIAMFVLDFLEQNILKFSLYNTWGIRYVN